MATTVCSREQDLGSSAELARSVAAANQGSELSTVDGPRCYRVLCPQFATFADGSLLSGREH